jgi:hypothetical protein
VVAGHAGDGCPHPLLDRLAERLDATAQPDDVRELVGQM